MFCSGQQVLAWCEVISWCVVFAQFSTPAMLLKGHIVRGLRASLPARHPWMEQNGLWLIIFTSFFWRFSFFTGTTEFIGCICVLWVFLPNYNCLLFDLSWTTIKGNIRWEVAERLLILLAGREGVGGWNNHCLCVTTWKFWHFCDLEFRARRWQTGPI